MKSSRVLVANRSEIACRIFQSVRELGLEPVGIATKADWNARHVTYASAVEEVTSYLDVHAIVEAAKRSNSQWIHPGYGFLSERPELVQKTEAEKLGFLGPRAETMELMGEKISAKRFAEKNQVPTLPWAIVKDSGQLKKEASRIGYPLLLKASSGGGGKGMRVVTEEKELEMAAESASAEAKASFGDGALFLEKCIQKPRHIEVQIFGDGKGNGVHLFERDCSLQRRHQKVWEEAPASGIRDETRKGLFDAALKLVAATSYRSAGTVEFLMDETQNFYFLEMNTRLQVEHPVTEAVSGLDLVRLQLQLGMDSKNFSLPKVPEVPLGHSIEVRVYAEDPSHQFMPSPGKIERLIWPTGAGIRIDSGIEQGQVIGTGFDPMLAKLIVTGVDRKHCIERLRFALEETVILGVGHNLQFLRNLCDEPAVQNLAFHTRYLDENCHNIMKSPSSEYLEQLLTFTSSLCANATGDGQESQATYPSPWKMNSGRLE